MNLFRSFLRQRRVKVNVERYPDSIFLWRPRFKHWKPYRADVDLFIIGWFRWCFVIERRRPDGQ